MAEEPTPPEERTPNTNVDPPDQIEIEAWYDSVEEEITQPDDVTIQSRYFWTHWLRILGPGPAVLLVRLRMYCYYNRQTGERRDWCFPGHRTLAGELGVERKTVMLYLRRLELFRFIRREPRYRYDAMLHKKVRTTDKYWIRMREPVAPEHEGMAVVKRADRTLRTSANPLSNPDDGPKSEKRTQVEKPVDNVDLSPKNGPTKAVRKTDTEEVLEGRPMNVTLATPTSTDPQVRDRGLATLLHSQRPERVADILRGRFQRRQPPKPKQLADVLPRIQTSPEQRDRLLRVEDLGDQIASQLGDSHSEVFYRKVARRFLEAGREQLVYKTLADIKEGQLDGTLHKPAAVFTARIKEQATINDIEL